MPVCAIEQIQTHVLKGERAIRLEEIACQPDTEGVPYRCSLVLSLLTPAPWPSRPHGIHKPEPAAFSMRFGVMQRVLVALKRSRTGSLQPPA